MTATEPPAPVATAPSTLAPPTAPVDAHAGHAALAGAAGHEKHVVQRTVPVNRDLAKRNLKAVMEFFGKFGRNAFTYRTSGGTHGKIPDAMKAEFQQRYPGLPVPSSVVFHHKLQGKPIGVVFTDKAAPVDLGLGTSHQHNAGSTYMQHIWFTPDDLDLAFSDTENGGAKQANKVVNGGAPKN